MKVQSVLDKVNDKLPNYDQPVGITKKKTELNKEITLTAFNDLEWGNNTYRMKLWYI